MRVGILRNESKLGQTLRLLDNTIFTLLDDKERGITSKLS
jgi:hypothetical protein